MAGDSAENGQRGFASIAEGGLPAAAWKRAGARPPWEAGRGQKTGAFRDEAGTVRRGKCTFGPAFAAKKLGAGSMFEVGELPRIRKRIYASLRSEGTTFSFLKRLI